MGLTFLPPSPLLGRKVKMENNNQSEGNKVREPQEFYGGWIKLYRQITESKIWETKPSSWITCWIYILLKVSFTDNNSYKKGEAHFRSVKYEALPFDITNRIWYNCLNWLEQEGMIKRRKVWRGEVITVLNYEKYQNNLSSENCKTGLEVNHMSIIEQKENSNLDSEILEQKNDVGKSYVNQREIITQTNIDKMQAQDTLKNIRSIRNKNNIIVSKDTIESEVSNSSLNEKEKDLKDTPPVDMPPSKVAKKARKGTGENFGHEIYHLVEEFCKEVGLEFKPPFTVKQMGKAASELLSVYTIDEIIEAVKYGKQKYIKEGEDPRHMIPHLQSVVKLISSWRGALKTEQEKKEKKEAGYGYF
jgi:hypothetical protein